MSALMSRAVTLGLVAALAACGSSDDGGFSPTVDTVSGSYSADAFTLTTSTGPIDLLALGSSVTVTLAPNGTTTGRLFVPGGNEDGSDLDEDLTGTWSLSGSTVTFSQTAATVIRDAEFTATGGLLTGEGTFNNSTIQLVLGKTS
jgi:hypothetical protein